MPISDIGVVLGTVTSGTSMAGEMSVVCGKLFLLRSDFSPVKHA